MDNKNIPNSIFRHFNKLRWLVLSVVFFILILLPFLYLYQTYLAAFAYDLLTPVEKHIYDTMQWLTFSLINDHQDLNFFKGSTWSGILFGFSISDPLAVVEQFFASLTIYWPFILSATIPLIVTLIFGRVYCGWICPATFIYELNDNLATWLRKFGLTHFAYKMDRRIKYVVLFITLSVSGYWAAVIIASFYPPAIIGREIYYAIALDGFGLSAIFFLMTLLFDILISRRAFCRYVCPGGALYSLLGRYRLVRIKRDVKFCTDCAKCNVECQFGLKPQYDNFGMECNNCSACIAVCPTAALKFTLSFNDVDYQGVGHIGARYKNTNLNIKVGLN